MSENVGLPELPSGGWTPIAWRPRCALGALYWIPIDGAPIDADTAHHLRLTGRIVMASRHTPEMVELVVRPAEVEAIIPRHNLR